MSGNFTEKKINNQGQFHFFILKIIHTFVMLLEKDTPLQKNIILTTKFFTLFYD